MTGSSSGADIIHDADDLPRVIPIFPLAGALLLPRGNLPLNIFEPRYLAMVRDGLEGDRLIGMIQPLDPEDTRSEPPIYSVGCLGRIHEHRDLPDGRILITLNGVSRFEVREELSRTTPYRKVLVDYDRFADDCRVVETIAREDRAALLADLKRFFHCRGLSPDWDAITQAPDETLVNALAMICPFEASEKQALLEAPTLDDRARTMSTLMTFAIAEPSEGSGAAH